MMRLMLDRVTIRGVRCFQELSLGLRTVDAPGAGWTILVGPNGVGKTTILQAIVLAAIDPRAISAVVETPWTMVRSNGGDVGSINLTYRTDDGLGLSSRTLSASPGVYVKETEAPTHMPLVIAFAARRRIARDGESPPGDNYEIERVRGLFDTSQPLLRHDPFKAFASDGERRRMAQVLSEVIQAQDPSGNRLFPLVSSLERRGRGGLTTGEQLFRQRRFTLRYGVDYDVRVALQDLSDGYQSMLALVVEVITQAALATGDVPDPAGLQATILVDELEAHLHPRWQRTVVPLLRQVFPRCQFVVSTHSPLVVGSARPREVHVLEASDLGDVGVEVFDERLGMLDAEEIYEEVFGVPRVASPDLVERERAHLRAVASGGTLDEATSRLLASAWDDASQVRSGR